MQLQNATFLISDDVRGSSMRDADIDKNMVVNIFQVGLELHVALYIRRDGLINTRQ